ncbi:MAG: hypothetical protein A2516_10820 [Alphaproteobacteria bacterium RIFOXYD12_FULL_60_8]|nr:MAG: hypothetical protein A2516_10820 [Alphaproteobacteria bacterium RIFOXYD12_FULL_60_8]
MKSVKWNPILGAVLVVAATLSLSACARESSPANKNSSSAGVGAPAGPSFSQFTDIPVPDGASMDMNETLLLGDQDAWSGRLVFMASYVPNALFDFFKSEMPRAGWQEITTVRSAVSVLSFRRENRIATVQIQEAGGLRYGILGGSKVSVTVSPQGGGGSGMDSGMNSGMNSGSGGGFQSQGLPPM